MGTTRPIRGGRTERDLRSSLSSMSRRVPSLQSPMAMARREIALTDAIAGEVPPWHARLRGGIAVGIWLARRLLALPDLFVRTPTSSRRSMPARRRLSATRRLPPRSDDAGFDLCCHGYRFARHFCMSEEQERAAIAAAVASLRRTVGRAPLGWQSRYSASRTTRRLIVEHGGFLYDADSYADDCPTGSRSKGGLIWSSPIPSRTMTIGCRAANSGPVTTSTTTSPLHSARFMPRARGTLG